MHSWNNLKQLSLVRCSLLRLLTLSCMTFSSNVEGIKFNDLKRNWNFHIFCQKWFLQIFEKSQSYKKKSYQKSYRNVQDQLKHKLRERKKWLHNFCWNIEHLEKSGRGGNIAILSYVRTRKIGMECHQESMYFKILLSISQTPFCKF